MTDKAEMLINRLIEAAEFGRVVLIYGGVEKQELDAARRDLVALIASQAAEIERLREQYRWRDVKVELPRGVGGVGQPELEAIVTNGSYAEVTEWMGSYWLTEDLEPTHWLPLPPLPGTRDTP